jgi:hypothetical protein
MKYNVKIKRDQFAWNFSVTALGMNNDGFTLPEIYVEGIKADDSIEKETQMLNIANAMIHILRGEPLPHNLELLKNLNTQIMTSVTDSAELTEKDEIYVDWEDLSWMSRIVKGKVEEMWETY